MYLSPSPSQLPSNWLKWLQESWDRVPWAAQLHWGSLSPAQAARSARSSQNMVLCLSTQLCCASHYTGSSRLWKLPFRGLNPYAQTGLLAVRTAHFRFPIHGDGHSPMRSQEQRPEPLPPESPIYYGTEIAERRLSVENVMRIESKRVKALSAHFIDSLFNEEINR